MKHPIIPNYNFLYIDRGKVKNKAHDVNQSQGPAGNTELIVLH